MVSYSNQVDNGGGDGIGCFEIKTSRNIKLAKVHNMHKLARNLTTNLQATN